MKRRLTTLALVAVVALILGACGGTKDTGFNDLPTPKKTGDGGGAKEIKLASGNTFVPATYDAKVGEAVVWRNTDGSQPHNVESDTGLFNSNPGCTLEDQSKCMPNNSTFTFTFKQAGEYRYYCVIHGTKGGVGMAGVVKVA